MSRGLVTTVALLCLAASAAPPRAAAEDLNPPLVGMHELTDAGKTVSIELPQLVEAQKLDAGSKNQLAYWAVRLYEDAGLPHVQVRLFRKPQFSRAPLHGSRTGSYRNGQLVDGSIQSAKHEWRETRYDPSIKSYHVHRMIEHGGEVFEAMLSCSEASYPLIKRHLDVFLSSFKGVGPPAKLVPPAGHKVTVVDGREVWTDVKVKSDVDRVLGLQADSWERMKSILPAGFATLPMGRVVICKDDASYAALGRETMAGAPPPMAFVAPALRALVVCVSPASKKAEFDRQVQRAAGVQCVEAAYGGPMPNWFEQGLSILHLFTTGPRVGADKPNPVALKDAKAAFARRSETLRDFIDRATDPAPEDMEDLDRLSWTWHLFLRKGPTLASGEGRERYQRYLQSLEETGGDVIAARALWDGTDFDVLKSQFGKWLSEQK